MDQAITSRVFRITVNDSLPWSTAVAAATSGVVEVDDSVLAVTSITPDHQKTYEEISLTCVSFGRSIIAHQEVLGWANANGFRPASVRETLLVPAEHPLFFRKLGYEHHSPAPLQKKRAYPDHLFTLDGCDLALVCLNVVQCDGANAMVSIHCLDHGDFDFISFWPCVDALPSGGLQFDGNSRYSHGAPLGRFWFALVPTKSRDIRK